MENFRISAESFAGVNFNLCHNLEWHDDERTVREFETDSLKDALDTLKGSLDEAFKKYSILRVSEDGDTLDYISLSPEEVLEGKYEITSSMSNNWTGDSTFHGVFFKAYDVAVLEGGGHIYTGKCVGLMTTQGEAELNWFRYKETKESLGDNSWSCSLRFDLMQ